MSFQINNLSLSKSLLEKLPSNNKHKRINIKKVYFHSLKKKDSSNSYENKFTFLKIISKNLQKYKTTKRQYETFIINSIIFDQKNHKVAVFKNYLLWDETSEFLKRFYKIKEIRDRIPKISEYYEKYTLFAPIYFGLDGLVILIMKKWTKRKKNYLEYIEDHEYDSSIKSNKKDQNFDPIIKSSLINEGSPTKSVASKNTLELTKYEIESTAKNKNKTKDLFKSLVSNKDFTIQKIDTKEINNKKQIFEEVDKKNSVSFSEIFDDLSSNYSILDNIHKKTKGKEINKNNKNIKSNPKKENIMTSSISINSKIKDSFSNKINKANNIFRNENKNYSINILSKKKNVTASCIPPCANSRQKKIGLIKKKKIYKFNTNNVQNIIQRNTDLLSNEKKLDNRILNSDGLSQKYQEYSTSNPIFNSVYNKKGTIKVYTSHNFLTDRNENGQIKNHLIDRTQKNTTISNNLLEDLSKKNTYSNFSGNMLGNMTERNYRNSKDRILINLKSKNKVCNSLRKNKNNYTDNINHNNRNSDSYSNKSCKVVLTHNRNDINHKSLCYLYERPKKKNLINCMIINNNTKKTLNKNDNKKFYAEDPLSYKMLQISNKKKKICLTTINSLYRIKEATNLIANNCNMSNNESSANKTNEKLSTFNSLNSLNNKKNLVLNQLTKKEIIYDNKKRLINQGINSGSLTSRDSSSSSMKRHFIQLNIPEKNSGLNTFRESQKSSQKIDLNLNLNIHFDIDVAKNGSKKVIFNNAIINQQHNCNTKFPTISAVNNEKSSNKTITSTLRNSYMKKVNKGIKSNRLNMNRKGKK